MTFSTEWHQLSVPVLWIRYPARPSMSDLQENLPVLLAMTEAAPGPFLSLFDTRAIETMPPGILSALAEWSTHPVMTHPLNRWHLVVTQSRYIRALATVMKDLGHNISIFESLEEAVISIERDGPAMLQGARPGGGLDPRATWSEWRGQGLALLYTHYEPYPDFASMQRNADIVYRLATDRNEPFVGIIDASEVRGLPPDVIPQLLSLLRHPVWHMSQRRFLVMVASSESTYSIARMIRSLVRRTEVFRSLEEAEDFIRREGTRLLE